MNTVQLKCVIECDPFMKKGVLGVYPLDAIPKTLPKRYGFILNTDPRHLPGQHWLAFYCDDEGRVEFFDSYGNPPSKYSSTIQTFMRRQSNARINSVRLQSIESTVCGQFCLFYLFMRTRGYSMLRIIDYFSTDYSVNDEFVYEFVQYNFSDCMNNFENGQICVKLCENKGL